MKIKTLVFTLVSLIITSVSFGQIKYNTRNGFIGFYSHTPVEDVKADNNQVTAVIDIEKGEFAFIALIKSFEFEKALMQEHFNENYMESDKFPKSTFSGKIKDMSNVDFKKDGEYPVIVDGNLTMKDKTNTVSANGTIIIKNGKIEAKSKFKIKPEDYNVIIPDLVKDQIAKEIEITVDVILSPVAK